MDFIANYHVKPFPPALLPENSIVIADNGPWDEFPTITNSSEQVVAKLLESGELKPLWRLFYYDSDRRLDEIIIRDGQAAGFRPGPPSMSYPKNSWTILDQDFYGNIPDEWLEAVDWWVFTGKDLPDFLSAVINNNLMDAVKSSKQVLKDATSLDLLPGLYRWLLTKTPPDCWGSPEKVAAWREAKRKDHAYAVGIKNLPEAIKLP